MIEDETPQADSVPGTAPDGVPMWFGAMAWASVAFMAAGCFVYLGHVMTDPATLSLDQRYAYEAEPGWVLGANAVAVWLGLLGTVLLALKKRAGEIFLLVAFAAVLVWLGGLLIIAPLRDAMSANDLIVAIVVAIITFSIYSLSRKARLAGWVN